MMKYALSFLAGIVTLQFFSSLPDPTWCLLLVPLLLVICQGRINTGIRLTSVFLTGFLWATLHAHWLIDSELPGSLEGEDLLITGVVDSLPQERGTRTRFLFTVDQALSGTSTVKIPNLIRLSWYSPDQPLIAGERWQLLVRLKRPRGFMNPGGFDYEKWLFQQGIRATGYVRSSPLNHKLTDDGGYPINRLRHWIRDNLRTALFEYPKAAGVFIALAVGDRADIRQPVMETFVATGTSHLIAISGLHISIAAGLGYWLIQWLWRRLGRLMLMFPAPIAAAFGAMLFALIYAALAGFTLPTQRALLMLLVVMSTVIQRRRISPFHSLALALMAVLLFDPLVVLSAGFWLSFAAVLVILWGLYGREHVKKGTVAWVHIQWVVVLGLLPVLALSDMTISLIAPLVNMIVIPLFSLIIVPLVLFTTVILYLLPDLSVPFIHGAGIVLTFSIDLLIWFSQLPFVSFSSIGLSALQVTGIVIATALLLTPFGITGKARGALLLSFSLFWPLGKENDHLLELTLLDVGQGLSLVARTRNHSLIYDTGPRYSEYFSAGSAVLIPFIRKHGIERIDHLILSNGDSDHASGLSDLVHEVEIDRILSGEPRRIGLDRVQPCIQGETWNWDGVTFEILSPDAVSDWQGNDASCVLRISASGHDFLITGDITRAVESYLINKMPGKLSADVVLIPHHGSETSSSQEFIDLIEAKYTLVSTGYRNRYGFPKPSVISRWQKKGAHVLDTANSGAIQFYIDSVGQLSEPEEYRESHRRYWHGN